MINPKPEQKVELLSKSQNDWIPHFNAKGEKMVSMPDI